MTARAIRCLLAASVFLGVHSVTAAQPPPVRGFLGAVVRDVAASDAAALGIGEAPGALVDAVAPQGPAEKAGLRPGHLIVSAGRRPVARAVELIQILGEHRPGDVIELGVVRAGRPQTFRVKLAEAPAGPTGAPAPGPPAVAAPAPTKPPTPSAGAGAAGVVRLRPFVVSDPQLGNLEALRLLVPVDWRGQGGIVWRHDRAILASAVLRFSGPNGEELNFLPIEQFAQSSPGYGFGIGSNYLGSELQPAMDPKTFVTRIVMPRYRREIGAATLGLSEEMPSVAAAAQEPGMSSQVRAGRFRFIYTAGGGPMVEDVYCVLQYNSVPAVQTIYWNPIHLHSMRAEQGRLDQQTRLMQTMVSSVRVNLQWFNGYQQIWQMWQQNMMQSIRSAGELSRYIARINDEITATNRQAWEQQQASHDRVIRRVSEYIRGVDTYRNPVTNEPVALPAGYGRAWTNRLGEYVVSDSASYNPNVGSNVEWQAMPRVP